MRKYPKTELTHQYELVAQWGAIIAEMPLEQWLSDLEHMDSVAPILDPTAYRDYLYSGKGDIIKDLLRGAIAFKAAVLRCRVAALKVDPSLPANGSDGSQAASPEAKTK